LKKYLTTPPTLVAPEPHENLQLCISITSNVVSTTIIIEWGGGTIRKIQYLVYFVSEVLNDSKTQYFHIMKLAYTLLIASHKLYHYFQVHQIEVHTSLTLGEILNNRKATEKLLNGPLNCPCMTSTTSQGEQSRLKL
jgi:hypothetical protein